MPELNTITEKDIEEQRQIAEDWQRRQELAKEFKGGLLRKPKSVRTLAKTKKGATRYSVTKDLRRAGIYDETLEQRRKMKESKRRAKAGKRTIKRAIKGLRRITRPYTKSPAWYRTRQRQDGSYRNPFEYEGMDSSRAVEPKFHVGTFSVKKAQLLDLRQKPVEKMPFKSPIQDEINKPMFGASLDLSNNHVERGDLLDLSNSNTNRLLDLKRRD